VTVLDLAMDAPIGVPEAGEFAMCYLRVSDDDQATVPEQLLLARRAAARFGLVIPDSMVFIDKGDSRSLFLKREGLQRMMSASSDRRATHLFVWIRSRLYGDPEQMLQIWTVFRRNGVTAYDADAHPGMPPLNGKTHTDKLVGLIGAWQAEGEVIDLRKRVRDTHEVKAGAGRLITRPPYGVSVIPAHKLPCQAEGCLDSGYACPVPHGEVSKKNGTVWVIDQDERRILELIYTWIANGDPTGEVARRLTAAGIKSRVKVVKRGKNEGRVHGGTTFSRSNIRKMLLNEFYKGEVIWGQYRTVRDGDDKTRVPTPPEEWTRASHTLGPLIDPDLWEQAKAQLELRHKTREESRKYPPMLFDGRVRCGRCGWKMYPRRRAHRLVDGRLNDNFDYVCTGVTNEYSGCERNHIIAASWLPVLLRGETPRLIGTAQPVEVTWEEATNDAATKAELHALQEALVKLGDRMDNLEQLAEAGFYKPAVAVAKKEAIDAERVTALARQAELLAAPEGAVRVDVVPEAVSRLVSALTNEEIPLVERQASLGRLIDRVVVDRPSVRFILKEAL
jgi:DNA invertase Pin-like site-specific DNA recombinase